MYNTMSALSGKSHASVVSVKDIGLRGMISLRGDLGDKDLQTVCADLTGCTFPRQGHVSIKDDTGLLWMSPDEIILMLPYDSAGSALESVDKALLGRHYLAVDVSDARAAMSIEGPFVRDVLAKLTPVDLHPNSFGVGRIRRTHLGQVAAALYMRDDNRFDVLCFRSVAEYLFDLLATSADAGPVSPISG